MTTWTPFFVCPLSFMFAIMNAYWCIECCFKKDFKEAIKYLGMCIVFIALGMMLVPYVRGLIGL